MLDRKIRKKIEWAFYNYADLREKGAEYLVELAERGLTASYDAAGVHGSGADNAAETRCVKAIDANRAAYWCKVVEKTLEHFRDTGKDTLIRLRYFDKKGTVRVCDQLYIDRRTLFYWVDDILSYALMGALQLQIIKFF